MLSTTTSYQLINRDLDRSLSLKGAEASVALETDYYLKHIGNVKSIDDFLKDTRTFNYAMKAFGLEDMAYAKGMIRKVLTDGVEDEKSFARRLNDDRFLDFAKTFDFAKNGEATTATATTRQEVVDRYVRQSLEIDAGAENEGVRLALYFERMAPKVTSAYGLLADPALWKVIQTVFNFPEEMAAADIDKQVAAVLKRLNIDDLKDLDKLQHIISRFTAKWDTTQNAVADPVLSLFSNNSSSPTISLDVIMTLKTLKYGGA